MRVETLGEGELLCVLPTVSHICSFGRPPSLQFTPEGLTGDQCCQIWPDFRSNLATLQETDPRPGGHYVGHSPSRLPSPF